MNAMSLTYKSHEPHIYESCEPYMNLKWSPQINPVSLVFKLFSSVQCWDFKEHWQKERQVWKWTLQLDRRWFFLYLYIYLYMRPYLYISIFVYFWQAWNRDFQRMIIDNASSCFIPWSRPTRRDWGHWQNDQNDKVEWTFYVYHHCETIDIQNCFCIRLIMITQIMMVMFSGATTTRDWNVSAFVLQRKCFPLECTR